MDKPPANMFHSRSHIREGDIVIIYLNRTDHLALTMTPGKQLHNKYGRYYHDDMIGLPFGSKMISPPPEKGYIYLLRPTPELWTKSLPHRTQILYQPDISYITMRLGVRAGGKVIEAGTGSGSMTHSLSRLVGPNGYVGSYEYHKTRYDKAKEEFESHGLSNVRLAHRNVCKDGFGNVQNVEAVFLDLPAPWEAIPHVMKVLRPDVIVKICCFSPCIEQVTKTCSALRAAGFGEVSSQEVLIRTHDIPNERNSGQKPLRDIESIVGTLQSHEVKKAERRVTQMRNAREKLARVRQAEAEAAAAAGNAAGGEAAGAISDAQQDGAAGGRAEGVGKRKLEEQGQEQEEEGEGEGHAKRARIAVGLEGVNGESGSASATASVDGSEADLFADDEQQDGNDVMRADDEAQGDEARGADDIAQGDATAGDGSTDVSAPTDSGDAEPETTAKAEAWVAPPTPASTLHSQIILRLQPEMRGHTSYLTFATLPPLHIRDFLAGKTDSSRPVPTPAPKSDKGKGKGKEKEVVDEEDSRTVTATATETEFADPDLDDKLGTLTEEEMIAMLSRD